MKPLLLRVLNHWGATLVLSFRNDVPGREPHLCYYCSGCLILTPSHLLNPGWTSEILVRAIWVWPITQVLNDAGVGFVGFRSLLLQLIQNSLSAHLRHHQLHQVAMGVLANDADRAWQSSIALLRMLQALLKDSQRVCCNRICMARPHVLLLELGVFKATQHLSIHHGELHHCDEGYWHHCIQLLDLFDSRDCTVPCQHLMLRSSSVAQNVLARGLSFFCATLAELVASLRKLVEVMCMISSSVAFFSKACDKFLSWEWKRHCNHSELLQQQAVAVDVSAMPRVTMSFNTAFVSVKNKGFESFVIERRGAVGRGREVEV
mmetsp:Transcript_28216/g.76167  ORF Transcript_28216/g.76167 Transcript_28216/m.76167 type:complete len:319 (-) Transcript_28216:254-1210(-)